MRHASFTRLIPLAAAALLSIAPAAAEELETTTLVVEDMTCAVCPLTVRIALERVDGVESAEVDFETKLAVVTFDRTRTDVAALIAATTDAGYPSHPEAPADSDPEGDG
jgi:periplasmic mercuric ion binding protein